MPDEQPIYIGNIGEGDNADWIKLVNGGRSQRIDLAAHHSIMVDHYTEQGEPAKAEHERQLLAILRGDDPERETTLAEHFEIMTRYYEAAGDKHMAAYARERRAYYLAREQGRSRA